MNDLVISRGPGWMTDSGRQKKTQVWKSFFQTASLLRLALPEVVATTDHNYHKYLWLRDQISAYDPTQRSELESQIRNLVSECGVPDWDGYGAKAIRPESASDARTFVQMMPLGTPRPDITPEPDGSIAFEWHYGQDRIIYLSFSGDGRASYASILGDSKRKRNGAEILNEGLVREVDEMLSEICTSSRSEPGDR